MLNKKNRIPRLLFARIQKNGAFFDSPHLSFSFVQSNDASFRFSFVVSKKVAKSAVSRNLLRRRGYSVLQTALPAMKKKNTGGVLGVFFFKKGSGKSSFREIQNEIVFLLKKAKII